MDNFDLKKYLVENKVTKNSRLLAEQVKETQDLAQAFTQAGIDMNAPVKVVEAGGGPGGSMGKPRTMDAKAVLKMLEAEKASFERDSDEGEDVYFDFEAGQSYPGAKLAIMFGDQYEYIIHQSGIGEARKPKHSRMMKEESNGTWTMVDAAIGGPGGGSAYAETKPFTGTVEDMKALVAKENTERGADDGDAAKLEFYFADSKVVAFTDYDGGFVFFVKRGAFPEPITDDTVYDIEEYVYNQQNA